MLTLAIRGIDVLNLSLGCFDNEPDSHLVMAHPVEHLHVTSTTSGTSPPGRRSGSRHRAAVPRLVALVWHVPVGCHRLRSDRRGDGRRAAHHPQAVTCCARDSSGPGATEPGDGVPAVPVVRPVNWWDVLVDDPAAAATAGARLPRSWCGSSPRPAERRALGGLPQAALDRSLRRVGNVQADWGGGATQRPSGSRSP